ncbi:DUF202 domain-containing protein [Micromonospora deserti]|uniref:DUF202 domain-containing protein n=1 Tax=Micromonospora deserti TaxID=2070366 RepID=A0A2W2CG22_9ACTN|nr:DUF202 domain-containing protein [Micromonospora deserti]PZF98355.1 hypothetical protein C1I99_13555 [Micromonospora deserti]
MSGGRDPGLQPERTRLAWRRTALALTVIMVLTVRLAVTGDAVGAVLAGVAVLGWGAALAVCWRRASGTRPIASGGRSLPLVALATAGFAALGALLVVRGLW